MRPPIMLAAVADQPVQPAPEPMWADYLDVFAALAAPPPKLDFVLPGLLAGTLGVLVSPGGTGKSMMALGIAASVAAGHDHWSLLGEDPAAGRVLVVSAEDPAEILARRLHAMKDSAPHALSEGMLTRFRIKAVHGKNWSLGTWDGSSFNPSGGLLTLEREIHEFQPRLLVLDTLNRCLAGINENDNAAMGRVVSEIERIITPTKTACLVLHHTTKATALQGQGDAQQAARGASAITDNARWQCNLITMSPEEADARGIGADERRQWVRAVVTKVNYAAAPADRWLQRGLGGVLTAATPPAATKRTDGGKGERRRAPAAKGDEIDAKIGW
jgi:RecA-family ATPase